MRRQIPQLPTAHTDEIGTLMADASHSLEKLDKTIDQLGNYDPITALPNRTSMLRDLSTLSEDDAAFALCVLSLRNLPSLQSAFGIEAGNVMLRTIAVHLERSLGPLPQLSHVDSSMFSFVLDNVDQNLQVADRVREILNDLPRECRVENVVVVPDLAMGVALHPVDGKSAELLLSHAMSASASAIDDGTASRPVGFFSQSSREKIQRRFKVEQDLRSAIENDELQLHYQPVIDLRQGRVTGAEALIRWNHPTRGLVSPAEFIPIAESSGLIEQIGLWVLESACQQLNAWSQTELADIRVAINLSARQFLNRDIVQSIEGALQHHGVKASMLEIELTETTAMTDSKGTQRTLAALREMGVTAAIDDFGTGYSSMSYLKTLPFDKLKIDREFVSHIETSRTNAAICKSLIELANGLGISVLAEGTERREEVQVLSAMGCGMFQGYYFAKPMAAHALRDAIGDGKLMTTIHQSRAATVSYVPGTQEYAERSAFQALN